MAEYEFETLDVFTEQRFGGNQLAVVLDGRGLETAQMQAIAAEFNFSETTFVLPPQDAANTARVRIFNRKAEMAFAGHPTIGTAFVHARRSGQRGRLRLEVIAGLVEAEIEANDAGEVTGARITAPQPLALGPQIDAATIAACLSLAVEDVDVSSHVPQVISMGTPFVAVRVKGEALSRCVPDLAAFTAALAERPDLRDRFSIHAYAPDGEEIRARMFGPLSGTWEDPATGSANAPLAALLLSLSGDDRADFVVRQGVEMGRPSRLALTAWKAADGLRASVAGACVPVTRGWLQVDD